MIKRSSAPTLLTVGLVLACVAGLTVCVEVAALDRGAVEADSRRLLETSQIEASMRPRAAAVLSALAPGRTSPGSEPDGAAEALLDDDALTRAFAGAVGSVSRHVLDGESGPIELDPALVHAAAVSTVAALDPTSSASLGDPGPTIALDTDAIPHVQGAKSVVGLVGTVAGIVGVLLIVVGLALSEKRIRAFARLGRWIAGAGVFVLLMFWLLPEFVLPVIGGWTEVAGVVMSSGGAFLVPGLVLVAVGIALNFTANRLIALGREHTLSVVPKAPMRRATGADRKWRNSA